MATGRLLALHTGSLLGEWMTSAWSSHSALAVGQGCGGRREERWRRWEDDDEVAAKGREGGGSENKRLLIPDPCGFRKYCYTLNMAAMARAGPV